MIIRLTQKLGNKVHASPTESLPLDPNPLADWSAHLFTVARKQYVLATNTTSLYSAVFSGGGVSTEARLLDRMLCAIREVMDDDGLIRLYEQFVAPSSGTVALSKAFSRSVTGSMNDHIFAAKLLMGEDGLSTRKTSSMLNDTPLSAIKYHNARIAVQSLGSDLRGEK